MTKIVRYRTAPVQFKSQDERYRAQLVAFRAAADQELARVERENFHRQQPSDRGLGEASLGLAAVVTVMCFLTVLMTFILVASRQPPSVLLINSGSGSVEKLQ
jgi:protein-L-isoaspartate O-methyltransferase